MFATGITASSSATTTARTGVCAGHHSLRFRARPALKVPGLADGHRRQSAFRSPTVFCQHGRPALSKTAKVYTTEVCTESDVPQPVPAWQKFAQVVVKGAAVAALAFVLTFGGVSSADAARSGGRVGGSSFGAARSGAGSYGGSSSLGGGMSGGLGGGRNLGSSPGLTGGYSGGTSYGSTGYSSFIGPGVFGGFGYGYGGGFGGPVVVQQQTGGGGGIITILLVVAALFLAVNVASSFFDGGDDDGMGSGKATVSTLQVGLLGSARTLQHDLERIAGRADTNTPEGLHYVLQETVLSLLRNPDYCVYGDSSLKNPRGLDGAEDAFNEVVMQERGKFKEETLVNVGGRSRRSSLKSKSDGMSELIVVTVIVAAEGGIKIPKVQSREELTKALNKLGALRSEQILAVEVMWTPQDEDDSYSKDELFLDYPTLHTL